MFDVIFTQKSKNVLLKFKDDFENFLKDLNHRIISSDNKSLNEASDNIFESITTNIDDLMSKL